MNQHTPEPWFVYEFNNVVYSRDKDGISKSITRAFSSAADARRIVACVNACAGISTETLEKFGGRAITAEAQRDELLVVLKLAEQWLEGWASAESQLTIIRQAIAKCEK